ncbi:MAG TPA: PAS domain-containing sensor histidine kinase [Beijerinckiaceae bacterium]|nr:PAS domain-containing sensor histidine kinase [Beijerinckiaceae bacterium]
MSSTSSKREKRSAVIRTERRFISWFAPVAVSGALVCAIATLLIFANYTPIVPTDDVVLGLFLGNLVVIVVLLALLITEAWSLIAAWRAQAAGAGLHIRIVGLFSFIAAAPAVLIAIVGSITLDRSLNPGFMQDVRGFVFNTAEAARLFRESECRSLLQEARLTAYDLNGSQALYATNRPAFDDFFASRVKTLGFTSAVLMDRSGNVIQSVDTGRPPRIVTPEQNDFNDAAKNVPQCLVLDEGRTFVALNDLTAFDNTFLYVARPVDPFAVDFPTQANNLIALYETFDAHRRTIQIAFAVMYVLLALILILSAAWLGVSFANRLVTPIRRLIAATDQVSSGNLYVQVPVHRSEGDLGHLGETFNKMTSDLRLQQNRLIAASHLIDERRVFTEAVLSGVPAAVIGVDAKGCLTVVNPSAVKLIETDPVSAIGRPVEEILPGLAPVLVEARGANSRLTQSQLVLARGGRERTFNVRVTTEASERAERSFVVTLDDITDLVTAQRTSAWADVARRIAHEIKNPLTPIQLSAERLKRKYGRVITEDLDIFNQCTDTIVRQVDDIKRMVDEFSSFARMPKARPQLDDLCECVRQQVFLMRVGHPETTIGEHLPETPIVALFDRRLLSQALTNVIKNATEGIAASESATRGEGRVDVTLSANSEGVAVIDVVDNGIGFPKEGRQRLLEPYMTTRAEGTGLGLPIVAKILEDHGGGIELLDGPTGGAHVRLYFPLGQRTDAEGETPARESSQPEGVKT